VLSSCITSCIVAKGAQSHPVSAIYERRICLANWKSTASLLKVYCIGTLHQMLVRFCTLTITQSNIKGVHYDWSSEGRFYHVLNCTCSEL